MLGNDWKCIVNCVSWFVSIILNFNAFCDAYTVQKEGYTMLLKSNICCLILGVTFGNYILTVSNEGEDHLCLYFVYFWNWPPIYEWFNFLLKILEFETSIRF